MNKTAITAILVLLLFAVPVSVCIVKHPDVIEMERRKAKPFPTMPRSLSATRVKNFFKEFESYYNDRFLGRSALLRLSNKIHYLCKSDIDQDKCYRGKDNWLFLGNSYDRCVDALTGKWIPSEQEREAQVRFFEEIDKSVRASGADFHMLIGPNKSSIYPEYLPPLTFPAKNRVITPLVGKLKASGISIFDAYESLVRHKDEGLLYYRTDTHWNHLGAKLAAEGFLTQSRLAELPELEFLPQGTHHGDLLHIGGYKKFPLTKGDNFFPQWKDKDHKAKIDKTVLVLGDSFSVALLYYLKGIFTNVQRIHYSELSFKRQDVPNISNYLQKMEKKPDIVIWIQVERMFAHWGNS